MDVFTHFALPFAAVYLATRRRPLALAAGVGGVAPDLDAATTFAAFWDPLFFLGHRGFSHSLLGAPLYALAFVLVLRAPFWERIMPIAREVRFGPRLAAVAMAASFTHLALDWLTMWGVPLLYPWSVERFTTGWFFYSVTAMIPVSAWLVWRVVRGRDTERLRRVSLALLLALALLAGGVRAATYPRDATFDVAQPAAGEWTWNALARTEKGWEATFYSWGSPVGSSFYVVPDLTEPGARDALARADEHVEARAFRLYAGGPVVPLVERADEGAWNVTYLDLMQRAQADRAPWFPFSEEAGVLRLVVHADGRVDEIDR